ncbi:MAG: hypothetical protein EXR98_10800 [Gemmataceae bacterium]|nr:hypothetical protein [Gemmataceae bacterium]
MPRFTASLLMVLLAACPVLAQADPLVQMGKVLQPMLADAMPKILYEKTQNWDHQAMVPVGLRWHGLKSYVVKSPRNHGEWHRLSVTSQDLRRTLDLQIYDVKNLSAEKQTFKVYLTFQMGAEYEQQNWANGLRLWSGSVRARVQVKAYLQCEDTLRFDTSKGPLPDFVFRMRVTGAKVDYDKLVVEHITGLGGDAAKLIGQAAHKAMNQWRPSIERNLLAKAGDAIVRAADTREIRVGFGSLLPSK